MLREQNITLRKLIPDKEGNWLYKDEDNLRVFSQLVYLGKDANSEEWHECSQSEKEEYEQSHQEE